GHALADELAIDPQFARAVRADNVIPANGEVDCRFNLLQRHELGNLDTVGLKIGIQERSAVAAMNHPLGHFFAAFRAGSTWPWRHSIFLLEQRRESGGAQPWRT